MFEILRRDGLARIGRLELNGKVLETPALLPVVNPKIFTVTARELHDEFGFNALITNSYIIKNNKELKEKALSNGLHEMLDFPGIIMTDSGTFQSHMYGEVEVTNEEMISFQKAIGTDIGTVLDIFSEPFWTREETESSIEVTLKRTEEAVAMKGDMKIAGVGQGSVYQDLRTSCALRMRSMDIDIHPIGGVVPLMEQYRYSELVDVIISSKKGLSPDRPVHLFGAGHPMVFSISVLLGCDMFDSASYAKFARDDRMMFIDGTFRLQEMQSLDCDCPACRDLDITRLRAMDPALRTRTIARHNLYEIKKELAMVKRYIREGRLWELAEQRCRAHPALLDALRKLKDHQEFLETFEPLSRDGAVFYTGPETFNRPVFLRYEKRSENYIPWAKRAAVFKDSQNKPYGRCYNEEFKRVISSGYVPIILSPFGPVPAELDEIYPLAQSVFPEIADSEMHTRTNDPAAGSMMSKFIDIVDEEHVPAGSGTADDMDIIRAIATARYQFGIPAADALMKGKIELVTSRKTGKIRNVISDGEHVLSMRAGDGLYTLRPEGAARIIDSVPKPHMRVVIEHDATPFVSEGRNVFCGFVIDCDENLRPMDETIVVDTDDKLIAVGRTVLTRDEMLSFKKGIAVKVRDGSGDK